VKLWAQLDNYNFWLRKYNLDTGWEAPKNVSNITDKNINVREPRIFGTPKSSPTACPSGDPAASDTTDATMCQNQNVVFLAWGTQTNVSPYNIDGPQDLGAYITVSRDAGAAFIPAVRLSSAQGAAFGDDESAYETQPLTRPDGTRFYSVWAQKDLNNSNTVAEYTSGDVGDDGIAPTPTPTPAPAPDYSGGGGCSTADGQQPIDPVLPLLAALGLAGWVLRRARRS
jgi:hypothetical protein